MRKINTRNFHVATRGTPRAFNRQILLNLIREHQPISRAELARRMEIRRSSVTTFVRELVASGAIYEKGTAPVVRGRRPTLLFLKTRGKNAIAVDVRTDFTSISLADISGRILASERFPTPEKPEQLLEEIGARAGVLTSQSPDGTVCEGLGIVVPGMIDRRTGRVIYAPRLGWRDVDLRDPLEAIVGMKVYLESAPIACALARLWLAPEQTRGVNSFAYVSISDGIGMGLVVDGEVLRGDSHTAGELGHVSLDPRGPICVCGKRGCWEALAGNGATIAEYTRRVSGTKGKAVGAVKRDRGVERIGVDEIVRRAKGGEPAAVATLRQTGKRIGIGLAAMVSAFNPGRIFIGGEVTAAWELLEPQIRKALEEGTLTTATRATQVVPDGNPAEYRLLGAVSLVAARNYVAPKLG
ncbi:MAG: hypothetical protein JWO05_3542 [Gemmatimonadetes bacterium]|nr:hypothetical protein [Gemmatimonadota bacterium]